MRVTVYSLMDRLIWLVTGKSPTGDLQKGMDALRTRDYVTAFRELRNFEEQGNEDAKYYFFTGNNDMPKMYDAKNFGIT